MLNMICLQGRLVESPELKQTESGTYVTSFTIANSTKTKNGEDKTEFIDCVAWTKTAQFICNYFAKGKEILITGRLSTRTYKNNENKTVKVYEVIVGTADFSASETKKKEEPAKQEEPVAEIGGEAVEAMLPFSLT